MMDMTPDELVERVTDESVKEVLKLGMEEAVERLKDTEKMELFLESVEKKIAAIPFESSRVEKLSEFVEITKSYIHKEYEEIPMGSMLVIVSTLSYFLSSVDLIPDQFKGIGYLDDLAVLSTALEMVQSDVEQYEDWKA